MRRIKPVVRQAIPTMKKIKEMRESGAFNNAVETVKEEAKELAKEVKSEIKETVENVKEIAKETVEEIKEVLKDAKEEIKEEVQDLADDVQEDVDGSLEDIQKEELIAKAKELGISVRKNWSVSTLLAKIAEVE